MFPFAGGLNGNGFFNEEYDNGYGVTEDEYPSYRTRSRSSRVDPLFYYTPVIVERVIKETEKSQLLKISLWPRPLWIPKKLIKVVGNTPENSTTYVHSPILRLIIKTEKQRWEDEGLSY